MKDNIDNFDNGPNLPFNNGDDNPFGLPQDYFASFEDKLKKRMEAENELSEFPLLSSIKKENAFLTPVNYFNEVEHKIELATELSLYEKLQSVKKPVFAALEEDYMQQLNTSVHYRIELLDELKEYKTLYSLDKENPFSVYEAYFEDLPLRIKNRIQVTSEERESVFARVFDFIFGKKMAMAFSLVLLVSLVVYLNKRSTKDIIEGADCKTLACLGKHEMLNDQAVASFDDDQLMDLVNVNALDKQLKSMTLNTDTLQKEEFILDNVNTDQLLEEL